MSALHRSDTKVSLFARLIDHFLVLAVIVALLMRLSGLQMFTNNTNQRVAVPQFLTNSEGFDTYVHKELQRVPSSN